MDLKFKSPRLYDIAKMADKDCYLADIGTDHGYLPIYLVLNGIVSKAIASDVAKGPLDKAVNNIKAYHLEDKITPILSNGFEKIPEDIDEAILAGMGQHLVAEIISKRKKEDITLILQPNDEDLSYLRSFLIGQGYMIIDEKVTTEIINSRKTRYYEIIKARKGKQKLSKEQLMFGPVNLLHKEENFISKWSEILSRYENILSDFKGNDEERNAKLELINAIKKAIG